ncbi:MAG: hypothetical protein ACK40S_05010 [Burkholderiaceae bacterium]
MNIRKALGLTLSHTALALAGFTSGIYDLPILIAPDAPTAEQVRAASAQALFRGEFRRDLKDIDALHWGERGPSP